MMASELWRVDESRWFLYIDSEHKREIQNIKRSRSWEIVATYDKNGKRLAVQYAVPDSDYRKAKRIEKRINESCIYEHESAK